MTILETLKDMARSKKFKAALLAAICWIAGKFGADLDVSELLPIVAPLWIYILGTGMQDWGKEAAKHLKKEP